MSFLSLADFKSQLIRKPLQGIVLVAPYSATALVDIATGTGGVLDSAGIATAHKTLGKITSDGVTFANSVNKQTTRGYGDAYPVRTDVESQDVSLAWSCLESRKDVFEQFYGVAQAGVTLKTTKTLTFDAPPLPVIKDVRVLALFKDNNQDGTGEIYLGLYLTRSNIGPNGDQVYSFTDACLPYAMQATALMDDVAGTAVRYFWSGPGFVSAGTAMGYS